MTGSFQVIYFYDSQVACIGRYCQADVCPFVCGVALMMLII